MASYADILKKSTSKPLESKRKLMIVEQAWPINCNTLINNPGFSHITSRIFGHLDHKLQLQCRLVGKSWNKHVDQPLFWLKKLEKKGQSKELSNAWCELIQRIEEGSFLDEKLRECLMKWYDQCHKWKESQLAERGERRRWRSRPTKRGEKRTYESPSAQKCQKT